MSVVVQRNKPKVDLVGFPYAHSPSKNYFRHLLERDIKTLAPRRSLDAGCGELRNFRMFPGDYVGIGRSYDDYFVGVERENASAHPPRKPPEVYLMRLESDFSFIGPVDLSVCTNVMGYIGDKAALLRKLASLTNKGGALLVDDVVAEYDLYVDTLSALFDHLEIVFWGYEGCAFSEESITPEEITDLSRVEMFTPNEMEGHKAFYIRAMGKKTPPIAPGERPATILDRGLFIVEKDIPQLDMGRYSPTP